jgi:ABC-2 type transport system permease protein
MNIFNKFFLWLLLTPSGIYRRMGVNVSQLHAILSTKLVMDDRRPSSMQQMRKAKGKNEKPITLATLSAMFFSAFMGAVFLVSFYVGNDYITQYCFYFSFYIFILASTLIADFTSVLIDVRDNMIILPKPINDKTFLLGRLLHIIIHVSKLVLPMALPGMVYTTIQEGIPGLLPFMLLILAATLFTIFLINALYVFILKVTTPEKFKNIISYFQIFFAILFYGGYQLVPRMMSKALLDNFSISSAKWAFLLPPYWFAASWQYLRTFDLSSPLVIYFVASLAIPVLSIWVVIKYFAPSFNQKLSMISGSGDETAPAKKNGKTVVSTTSSYINLLANWFTEKGPERMAFLHTWKLTGRSRDFKMKVYPSIGYIVVYLVLMVMNNKNLTLATIKEQTGFGKFVFISVIYFSSFLLMMAIRQLMYSDKYKAAWIYYITPIQTPGRVFSGAMKATIAKFYLPLVVLTTLLAFIMVGPKIIPNLLLGFFNQVLITAVISYITIRSFPFSEQQSNSNKGGGFIRGLFSMIIPLILAVLQYFVYSYSIVIMILCVLSGIATWLMIDAVKNKSWKTVNNRNYEE